MRTSNFPLRAPASIMEEARKAAAEDGVSLNQFIATYFAAVAGSTDGRADAALRAVGR